MAEDGHAWAGRLVALLDELDRPLVVRLPVAPHAATRRLMDALGVEIVVEPVVRSSEGRDRPVSPRTTERVHADDGSLTISEMNRREAAARDAQPMTTRCAVGGCEWVFEGTAGAGRDAAEAHRAAEHPWVRPGRITAGPPSPVANGRDALERMDVGEPQQPTEEVAAPVEARAVDGATPGDASGEGNEPGTGAAAPPRGGSWTRDQVVAAIQRWAREHDGRPPTQADWLRRGEWWPTFSTAAKVCDGWGAALAAAGFTATARGRPRGSRVADSTSRSPSLAAPNETPAAPDRPADAPSRPDAADPLSVAGLTLEEIVACGRIMAAVGSAVYALPKPSRVRVAEFVAALLEHAARG